MRIGLMISKDGLYSSWRLGEEAASRGHEVALIDLRQCALDISFGRHRVLDMNGHPVTRLDAVIPRILPDISFFGLAVLRQFEAQGVFALNSSASIAIAQDKLHTIQVLAAHGLPVPETAAAASPACARTVIDSAGGAPLVLKLPHGMRGRGVSIADTRNAALSMMETLSELGAPVLAQRYVGEAAGRDLRCHVIGGRIVASMERIAGDGEFRANVALGAETRPATLTAEEEILAVKAAEILGLNAAGIDILRSNGGPLVIEANACAGFKNIDTATGANIAAQIIEYLESRVRGEHAQQ